MKCCIQFFIFSEKHFRENIARSNEYFAWKIEERQEFLYLKIVSFLLCDFRFESQSPCDKNETTVPSIQKVQKET